jgi:hypothetical protein
MSGSKGQAHAKGHAKTGGRLSTGKGPKNPHTQTGGRPQ